MKVYDLHLLGTPPSGGIIAVMDWELSSIHYPHLLHMLGALRAG